MFTALKSHPLSMLGEQVRLYDRDRFLCSLFTADDKRENLWALYAFNIELAKIPDVTTESATAALRRQWWLEAIQTLATGHIPPMVQQNPLAAPLIPVIQRYPAIVPLLETIIAARAFDMEAAAPTDLDMLVDYSKNTAGALGEASVHVLQNNASPPDKAILTAAREAGIAFGLTNAMRHAYYQATLGKIWLPVEILAERDITPEALLRGLCWEKLAPCCAIIAETATRFSKRSQNITVDKQYRRIIKPALLPALLSKEYNKHLRRNFYRLDAPLRNKPSPMMLLKMYLN